MISEYKASGKNIFYIFMYFIVSLVITFFICFLIKDVLKLSDLSLLIISILVVSLNAILLLRFIRTKMDRINKTKEEIRNDKINRIIKR